MNEVTTLVFAIFSAVLVWTTSVIGGMIWLNGKFRSLENTIYRELEKMRREYELRLFSHNARIQRLEIKAFGFTGGNGNDPTLIQVDEPYSKD